MYGGVCTAATLQLAAWEYTMYIMAFGVWRDSYVYTLRNEMFFTVTLRPDTVVLSH